jgi:hypothetical protein
LSVYRYPLSYSTAGLLAEGMRLTESEATENSGIQPERRGLLTRAGIKFSALLAE